MACRHGRGLHMTGTRFDHGRPRGPGDHMSLILDSKPAE
jgi:hypothetical protein